MQMTCSHSLQGTRIQLLHQAASLFLREIIEDTALVGIVVFSSTSSITKPLTVIDGEQSRKELVSALPTSAGGGTQMCAGIKTALEVKVKEMLWTSLNNNFIHHK